MNTSHVSPVQINSASCIAQALNNSFIRKLRLIPALVIGAALACCGGTALADTTESTWTNSGTNWSTSGNWGNGVPSTTVSAEFNGTTTYTNQPTLTAASTSQGIWDTGASGGITTTISGTFGLTITGNATLDNIANVGILLDGAGNNKLTISSAVTGVTLTNSTSFIVNNGGTLTVAAPLTITAAKVLTLGSTLSSGSGSIVISGAIQNTTGAVIVNDTAGTTSVTMSGANAYTGTTTVTAGTLNLTGTLNGSSMTVNGATGNLSEGATGVIAGAASTLTITAGSATLNGANTYGGLTTVNGGTLQLNDTVSQNVISSTNAVTLGGGKLIVSGSSNATAVTQTIGTFALTANTSSSITLADTGATLGTSLSSTNALATPANGTTLYLNRANGGNLKLGTTSGTSFSSWAIVTDSTGTGFGSINGSNQLVRSTATTGFDATSNSGTANFITNSLTDTGLNQYSSGTLAMTAATHATNSLFINADAATGVLDLSGTSLTFASNALGMSGTGNYTIQNGQLGTSGSSISITQVGSGTLAINSTISGGAGGFTKGGSGMVILGASNSYTGTTTVAGGTLLLGTGGGINSSTVTTLGAGNALTLNGAGVFDLNGKTQALGTVTNGASSTITSSSGTANLTIGNASSGAGNWTGSMNVTWNQGATSGTTNGNWLNTGNITLNANGAGAIALNTGAVNNTGAIANSGTGSGNVTIGSIIGTNVTSVTQNSPTSQLILAGNNATYANGVSVLAGQLQINTSLNALGSGTLTLGASSGTANTTFFDNVQGTISNPISVIGGNSGTATITFGNVSNTNFAILNGTITLNNHDLTVSANSAANGGTGSTWSTIGGGISGTGNVIFNFPTGSDGGIQISGGSLNNTGNVTFSGSGNPRQGNFGGNGSSPVLSAVVGSNVNNVIVNGPNLTLNISGTNLFSGSLLVQQGSASLTSAQAANAAGGKTIFLGAGSTSNNATLFVAAGVGSITISNPLSLVAGDTGALTLWLQSTNTAGASYTGAITLNGGDTLTLRNTGGNGAAGNIQGGITGTGNLVINNSTSNGSLNIQTGTVNINGTITEASSSATAGVSFSANIGPNVTQVIQNSTFESLMLSGSNSNAPTTSGSAGTLVLAGNMEFLNRTSLYSGSTANWTSASVDVKSGASLTFRVNGGGGQFTSSDLDTIIANLVQNGTTTSGFEPGSTLSIDLSANLTYSTNIGDTGGGQNGSATGLNLNKTGAGTLTLSGSNSYTGATSISTGQLNVSSFNSVNGGSPLLATSSLGAPVTVANGTISLGAGTTLNYTGSGETTDRFINLTGATATLSQNGSGLLKFLNGVTATGANAKTLTLSGTGAGEIDGAILDNTGVNKTSVTAGGNWVLNGPNSYSGVTTVSSGTLAVNTLANGGLTGLTISTTQNSTTATLSGTTGLVNGATYFVASANVPGGTSFTFSGSTLVTLSNNATTTAGGTASVIGVANSLGISGNAAANLLINNGATLQYTGSGTSTDRLFTLNDTVAGGTATLDASGSGAVNFTNSGSLAYGTAAQTRTLILQGTNTGANTLAATIANNTTGATSLTKNGTGTWVLSGSNSYTGATSVLNGVLKVNGSLGNTAVTVGNSTTASLTPTLGGGNGSATGGSLTSLGNTPTLQVYTSSGTVGNIGGAVTISGTSASGSAGHLAPGNSVGTLTVGSLTLSGGSILDYEFNGTANDFTVVSGALTLNSGTAGINLYQEGGTTQFATAGTYDLFQYGSLVGGVSNLSVLNPNGGFTYTFGTATSGTNNYVTLTIAASGSTTATNYTLSVSAGTSKMLTGGSTAITTTITNTGTTGQDGLSYTGLGSTVTGGPGSVTGGTTSGSLAVQTSGSNAGNQKYVSSGSSGVVTVTAGVSSANNSTLGGAATLTGSAGTVSVSVYDPASLSFSGTGNGQTWRVSNAAATAGGLRSDAIITSATLVAAQTQAGWSTALSGTIASSGSAVAASFTPTGKLNGSYQGKLVVSAQNDQTISGASANDVLNSATTSLTATVAGNTSTSRTNVSSADVLSGQSYGTTVASSGTSAHNGTSSGYGLAISGTVAGAHTNTGNAGIATTATLINGVASARNTVKMSFDTTSANGVTNSNRTSDILTLSGLNGTNPANGQVSLTDTYVLQLTYDTSATGVEYIAWNNGSQFVNAIMGNDTGGVNGNAPTPFGTNALNESYADYLASNPGSLSQQLGAYGYYNGVAWAVLDHSGISDGAGGFQNGSNEFAVIPEPSTWGMILGGFGMLIGIQRLRKRRVGI